MDRQELATKLIALNSETVRKLERWFVLFELQLAKAEEKQDEIDLKEIVNFTKALGEVIKLEDAIDTYLGEEEENDKQGTVDPEAIRRLLSE